MTTSTPARNHPPVTQKRAEGFVELISACMLCSTSQQFGEMVPYCVRLCHKRDPSLVEPVNRDNFIMNVNVKRICKRG